MARFAAFGNLVFEVSGFRILTFSGYNRKTRHKYSRHQILNNVSKLESVGIEPQEISMKITLLQSLGVDVKAETAKIRKLCDEGTVDYLIVANEVLGLFVIEEVTEDAEMFDCWGRPILSKLDLKFVEYNPQGDF